MRSFGSVLSNPVARSGDRLGSAGTLGTIEHFSYEPGSEWLPADGQLVDWSAQLAKVLQPSASTLVAGTASAFNSARAGCFGNGLFAVVSNTSVARSSDGITWLSVAVSSSALRAIAFGAGRFVAVDNDRGVWLSTDLVNWTKGVTIGGGGTPAIAFVAGLFVVLSVGVISSASYTSPDGTTWTARTLPASTNWQVIASDGDLAIAAGAGRFACSRDGLNWNLQSNGNVVPKGAWVADGLAFCGYDTGSLFFTSDAGFTGDFAASGFGTAAIFCKLGDELAAFSLDTSSVGTRTFGNWRSVSIGSTSLFVVAGNGMVMGFGANSYIRSTQLRTPRIARRPGSSGLRPYIKVA